MCSYATGEPSSKDDIEQSVSAVNPADSISHSKVLPTPIAIAFPSGPGVESSGPQSFVSTGPLVRALSGDRPLMRDAEGLAKNLNTPVEMALSGLLATAAASLGALVSVGIGTVWREPAVFWVFLVGPPGTRKTDLVALPRDCLTEVQKAETEDWHRRHEAALAERAQLERELRQYEAECRRALREDRQNPSAPGRRPDSVVVPIRPEIIVDDTSIEDLAERSAGSARGVIAVADEVTRIFTPGTHARTQLLRASRAEALTVGRVSRQSYEVKAFAVSVLAGTQPDRLAKLIGPIDDGLFARVLWTWQSEPPRPRIARDAYDLGAFRAAVGRLRVMGAHAAKIPMGEDAIQEMEAAMERWHAEAAVGGLMRSWLSKAPGHAARLALVMEALAGARRGTSLPAVVSAERVRAAISLIDAVYKPAMVKVLERAGKGQTEQMRDRLLAFLVAERVERFNRRRLGREQAALFGDARRLKVAIDELVEDGVLRRADRLAGALGRMPGDYVVNRAALGAEQ